MAAIPYDATAVTPPSETPPEDDASSASPERQLFTGRVPPRYNASADELARLRAAGFSDIVAFDDETNTATGYNGLIGSQTTLVSRGISSWRGSECYIVTDQELSDPDRHRLVELDVEVVPCTDETQLLHRSGADMFRRATYPGAPGEQLQPLVVTWNGSFFDIPLTLDRCVANDMDPAEIGFTTRKSGGATPPPAGYQPLVHNYPPMEGHDSGYELRWHNAPHVDLLQAYRDATGRARPLKKVARANLGIEPAEIDYARMHHLTAGQLAAYTASDVVITRQLAFTYLDALLARIPPRIS